MIQQAADFGFGVFHQILVDHAVSAAWQGRIEVIHHNQSPAANCCARSAMVCEAADPLASNAAQSVSICVYLRSSTVSLPCFSSAGAASAENLGSDHLDKSPMCQPA